MTIDHASYGIFLMMGNVGLISSTVLVARSASTLTGKEAFSYGSICFLEPQHSFIHSQHLKKLPSSHFIAEVSTMFPRSTMIRAFFAAWASVLRSAGFGPFRGCGWKRCGCIADNDDPKTWDPWLQLI